MRKKLSYFEKSFFFKKQKLLGKETSTKRRESYFENRLPFGEKRLLKRDFF